MKLAQGVALAAVVGLLGLLVWKVVTEQRSSAIPAAVAGGKKPSAPLFELPLLRGEGTVELRSLRGRVVVLNVWASWCRPCASEAADLEASWRRWKSKDVVFLGMDWHDAASDARGFARKHGVTYPLVRDRDGQVLSKYGVDGVPQTFFIDREGRLVGEHFEGPVDQEALSRNIELARS